MNMKSMYMRTIDQLDLMLAVLSVGLKTRADMTAV